MKFRVPILAMATLMGGLPTFAQQRVTLSDAIARAVSKHPSIAAMQAAVDASTARIEQARSGRLPKVNYVESFQRSNNPVFVFSSLLTQHQFTLSNFNIGPLNRPDALNNFQSTLIADQVLYDGNRTSSTIKQAQLAQSSAQEQKRFAEMALIAAVARSYYGVIAAGASLNAARQSVASAEADLKRARDIRAAGMSTEADVLSIEVHLAAVREQQIRREFDVEIAKSALNEAMGEPLSAAVTVAFELTPAAQPALELTGVEDAAIKQRSEVRQASFAFEQSQVASRMARASYLPEVTLRAAFEADRQRFVNRGGANWLTAVNLRWNIFNGGEDRAKIRFAAHESRRAELVQREVASSVRLEVRRAWFDWNATNQRIAVAEAAVRMAEESLRIIKNRYDAGLTTVTELLRNEVALLDTRTRLLLAMHDQRLASIALELAAGTLSAASPALQ